MKIVATEKAPRHLDHTHRDMYTTEYCIQQDRSQSIRK